MLRQYSPGRHRYERIRGRDIAIGTIPIGTIYRIHDERTRRSRSFIVEAWLPREYASINRHNRTASSTYLARAGHLAIVRDLGNGSRTKRADHFIRHQVGD